MDPFDFPDPRRDNRKSQARPSTKPALHLLGYYGLIPFFLGVAVVWLSPMMVEPGLALIMQQGTLFYGGIIAAYMAGMGAGGILSRENEKSGSASGVAAYLPGIIATLIAWFMILPNGYFFFSLSPVWRLIGLIVVFIWLFVRDRASVAAGHWPKWYGDLRLRLTAWVVICLSAIVARLLLWGYT